MIAYKTIKIFDEIQIADLFNSVNWESVEDVPMLKKALANSTNIISAWDEEKLVGIIRSMDDGLWSANIDCLIVHKDYQGRGIGKKLVKELLAILCDVKYINISPNEAENIAFYEKLGFMLIDGSRLLQIVKD